MRSAAVVCLFLSCARGREVVLFPFEITAAMDDDQPASGVRVTIGGRELGLTDASGEVRGSLAGRDGQRVTLTLEAPANLRAIGATKQTVTLQVLAPIGGGDPRPQPIRMRGQFAPLMRGYVVLVRTDGRPGIPVLIYGKSYGATNETGVAQILFRAPPGDELMVKLDTGAYPRLRPANPTKIFQLSDRDDVFVFRQEFDEGRGPRPRRIRSGYRAPRKF